MRSAFGYQGQKCSACSRLIVVDAIYARLLERLLDAARSVRIGPAEDPAYFMGPVIERAAQEKVREYVNLARQEGRAAFVSEVPDSPGFYVPLTIATEVPPDHRLAQEEIFGPVLSILRARDFDQALAWANATRFALTGGLFSRTPSHIERGRRDFRVGNLYINRGTTGAIVGRGPRRFQMSGIGSRPAVRLPAAIWMRVVTGTPCGAASCRSRCRLRMACSAGRPSMRRGRVRYTYGHLGE
jgi:RHH-type proline utilization regulon transcriptional repressor/proline dehydrogenase/delta 1-pyrroline-5-carboxylate dehydrogenase